MEQGSNPHKQRLRNASFGGPFEDELKTGIKKREDRIARRKQKAPTNERQRVPPRPNRYPPRQWGNPGPRRFDPSDSDSESDHSSDWDDSDDSDDDGPPPNTPNTASLPAPPLPPPLPTATHPLGPNGSLITGFMGPMLARGPPDNGKKPPPPLKKKKKVVLVPM